MPGKTGAPHEIPYVKQEDKPPSAEEATKPLAERVHKRLDEIAPSQIVKQTAGKLLIANASGVITGTAMSGDVTISSAGVTEIGAAKVGTTELADKGVTTAKMNDEAVTLGKLAEAVAQALIPLGAVLATTLEEAASGFLLLVGEDVSRSTYAGLFAKWGTKYGAGNGSTTFGTPDWRGRSLYGKGTHSDVNALTDNDGLSVSNRTPKHIHEKGSLAVGAPSSGFVDTDAGTPLGIVTNLHVHPVTGSTALATIPYAVVNWMVKY